VLGVAVSGVVDGKEGICHYYATLQWRDVPIAELFAKSLLIPAWVDNDANVIAVGERFFGNALDAEYFTSIMVARSIRSAHYMHGMLSWQYR
jgi:predicted NBD/HSP70 family sugar kinase